MKTFLSQKRIDYTGRELRSGWIRKVFDLEGSAIVAFAGGCNVAPEYMVDLEDLEAGASIYSEEMLHFIAEHPGTNIKEIALLQRVLIFIIKEILEDSAPNLKLFRDGDDLYDGKAKLTISIATTSPVSGLIHSGINISNKNTPVITKGLKDFDIDPSIFAGQVLNRYKKEFESLNHCTKKVKLVN